jgi:hypothetical protein
MLPPSSGKNHNTPRRHNLKDSDVKNAHTASICYPTQWLLTTTMKVNIKNNVKQKVVGKKL